MNNSDSSSSTTHSPSAQPLAFSATHPPSTQPSSVASHAKQTTPSLHCTQPLSVQQKGDPITTKLPEVSHGNHQSTCNRKQGSCAIPLSVRSHDLLGELSQSSLLHSKLQDSLKRSQDTLGGSSQDSYLINKSEYPLDGNKAKRQKLSSAESPNACTEMGPGLSATVGAEVPPVEARPFGAEARPYVRRRVWDTDLQKFVVKQS